MQNERNATFSKLGGPGSLVAEYEHWCVLARPKQVTLGSLVLLANSAHERFSDLPQSAFSQLAKVTSDIETALEGFVTPEKLNYLMLMMVDPHVHFHVIPRYSATRRFEGTELQDVGWPGPPDLSSGIADESLVSAVCRALSEDWPDRG